MMFTRNFIPPSSLFIMCNVSSFLHTYIPSYVSKYLSGRKQVTTCEQEKRARKKRETFLIRYHLSWKNLFLFASFFLHKTPRDAKKENKLFSLIQIRSELIFRKENIYLLYRWMANGEKKRMTKSSYFFHIESFKSFQRVGIIDSK